MEEKKTFPNIPVSHWNKLRLQFKKSIPGSITSNYIASVLSMTETSAKANVLPSLRMVGLIDENDNTNQEAAKRFRDDNQYKDYCLEVLERVYPQGIRDAFPDSDSNKEGIKTWFMNHSGVGQSAAGRITAFYMALLEADPNAEIKSTKSSDASTKKVKSQRTGKVAKVQITTPPVEKEATEAIQEKTSPHHQNSNRDLPGLNINIQIHISSDATPDQIEKIFESMAKHLYKNN